MSCNLEAEHSERTGVAVYEESVAEHDRRRVGNFGLRRRLGLAHELKRGGIHPRDLVVPDHHVVDHHVVDHHVGDHDDDPQDGASREGGRPQAQGTDLVDDPHVDACAGNDVGGAAHHDFRSGAYDHAAEARRRAPDDDERPQDEHHQHRPPGLYEHPAGVLAAVVGPAFVLVAGPPGSGKSSLAVPLARELGLPLLAKDEIKEALMGVLGPPATVNSMRAGASGARR
ncbi:MAG: hypothetical protein JO325_08565 [Solirubrobacterales bacterium]|nr:hypothetical protein [Solirubrobacterales bacterium]